MSTEYWASVGVGFQIDPEKHLAGFRRHEPEQVVMEDRFDTRTGRKLPHQERVVIDAQDFWVLDGVEYDDLLEFLAVLAETVDAVADRWGQYEDGQLNHSIELPNGLLAEVPNDEDIDPVMLAKHIGELERIGQRLRELGIEVGPARIFAKLSSG